MGSLFSPDKSTPIAVIGIGFRGPGDATNTERLWSMISESKEAWSPIPVEKFNNKAFVHPDSNRNGTSNVNGGHYFKGDLSRFDAPFFNMTSAEAVALDPLQRLLLECCYEAFENAGIPLNKVVGSDTAVFMGSFFQDYTDMLLRDPETLPLYQSTSSGQSRAMISNRLSYFYDLKGPSVTIDTACSSSLVALHLACQSLRSGESKQAVVGGANVILSHEVMITMSMMRFLSPDGRCYTFDSRANGYARGEGAGCILIKPLIDAIRDGDTIRGVIRNTGVNQDGKTAGITLPSRGAQEGLIRRVYKEAGLNPLDTTYVEAHGTGTPAGDPIEAAAISSVFGPGRPIDKPLAIGSVKTNIGHLEGASGVAGVIKAILMLENRLILPNRNFDKPNQRIPLQQWKLRIPTSVEPWVSDSTLRASINSFGYGGTNAHVIIDAAIDYLSSHYLKGSVRPNPVSLARLPISNGHAFKEHTNGFTNGYFENGLAHDEIARKRIFLLSANDELAAKQQAKTLIDYLESHQDEEDDYWMDRLAYTLNVRRTLMPWKAAIYASSIDELASALKKNDLKFIKKEKAPVIAFIFTGQGAQWNAMGRELLKAYPVFRRTLDRASHYLDSVGAPWSLIDELSKDVKTSRISLPILSQPLCTAVQLGIVDLFNSWGIRPAAVTGHSSGEIAAAYAMGVLTLEDAMAVSHYRGVAASKVQSKIPIDGAMMAAGLSKADAEPLIAALTQGTVTVACENSPKSITISGDKAAILELEAILKEMQIFARKLLVDVAYHSYHMECVAEEYLASLEGIKIQHSPNVEFYSSVTGRRAACSILGPAYWVANMLSEVKFSDSLHSLCLETNGLKKGSRRSSPSAVDILIEIGPHSALAGPIKEVIQADTKLRSASILYMSALARNTNAVTTVLDVACKLATNGKTLDFTAINRPTGPDDCKILVDLPPYSWNRSTSYWAESRISKQYRTRTQPRNDLLGVPIRNTNPIEPFWRNIIRPSEIPWVRDHKVQSNIVYPGAGFVVMAIEAAFQRATERAVDVSGYKIREITIGQALVIPEADGEVETLVSLRPYNESLRIRSDIWDEFCVFSVTEDNRWTEHCRGLISVQKRSNLCEVGGERHTHEVRSYCRSATAKAQKDCQTIVRTKELYDKLTELGIEYGPTFANMVRARAGASQCIGTISIPDTASVMPMGFQYPFVLHPATLDSCFHSLFAAIATEPDALQDPMVPVFIEELFISQNISNKPSDQLVVYTSCKQKDSRNFQANMLIFADDMDDDEPVITITGLTCTTLAKDNLKENVRVAKKLSYHVKWEPDADFVDAQRFTDLCLHIQAPPEESARVRLLERAAFYLIERALNVTSAHGPSSFLVHHMKLYTCMENYCKAVRDDSLGYPTSWWLSASELEKRELILEAGKVGGEGRLVCHIGESLPRILRQEVDPLSLMLEDDRLAKYYADSRLDRNYAQAAAYIKFLGYKNPHLKIIEIGAGTGGATVPLLNALTDSNGGLSHFASYDFTDISSGFFDNAKAKLASWGDLINFRKLDIEVDPLKQGFEAGSYDLVIAANVLHATSNMDSTLSRVRRLMKPGGKLVLVELVRERMATSLIFGTLPGWWIAGRPNGPCLTETEWDDSLRRTGFSGLKATLRDSTNDSEHRCSVMVSEAASDRTQRFPPVLIVTGGATPAADVTQLQRSLEAMEVAYEVASLADSDPVGKVCIVLSELTQPLLSEPTSEILESTKKILLKSDGALWVIRGGMRESRNPSLNLITGLARTVRSEKGDSMIVVLDLDPRDSASRGNTGQTISEVFKMNFNLNREGSELLDVEYVERDGIIMIPRIVQDKELNEFAASTNEPSVPEDQPFFQEGRPMTMEIGSPGLLDTVHFIDDVRMSGDLPEDCVEIEVKASGINFRDVMMALGQIEVEPFGGECSGTITAVGSSVEGWKIGDRVVTYKIGCFSNFVRQEARALQRLPNDMSFEVAASLPVIYCTAYHSVFNVARVRKGETVLIHAASGGLGQATIMLCQMVEAEVFATVGTLEKKKFLMSTYGIPEDHIFSSRDSTFYSGVMHKTGGRGVDIIMNSVAGDALRLTWNCIAPFGRFIELGKRDLMINSRLEMERFKRNVTFAAVDLVGLIRERPVESAEVFRQAMDLIRAGTVKPPSPVKVYGFSEIEGALRTMQAGKHMGKLVAVAQPNEKVKVLRDRHKALLRADVSYLLVGGLGGLGRAIALWMVQNGARNIIFASRSGLSKQSARDAVALLKKQGCNVAVYDCDISSNRQFEGILARAKDEMPPIRGVIQAAMVLRDAHFERLALDDYTLTIKPKVQGTWNLHNNLPKDLDFFIMLSSISGVIGNASQAAYAAAGTFMDAFAEFRNSLGLPAITIDLGFVFGIGYIAENEELRKAIEKQGLEGLTQEEVIALIKSAIMMPFRKGTSGQTISGLGTWNRELSHSCFGQPLFSHFRRSALKSEHMGSKESKSGGKVRDHLRQAQSVDDAVAIVCNAITRKMSTLLMIPLEDITMSKSMAEYGMDSLVAVEMRNWLFREMDSAVPILELLANRTPVEMARRIVMRSRLVDPAIVEYAHHE